MKYNKINVRATALEEFWGDEYDDFKYLWEGAMHKQPLSEMSLVKDKVCDNPFPDQKAIEAGHLFCKDYYFRTLPVLAKALNEIHDLDLDNKTWGIAFGYWLYRHISVVYDKYITLSNIDLENSSIKLLCESCYYVPENHTDYIFTFANDFGVQQLVSLFYRIFSEKKFDSLQKTHDLPRKTPKPSTIDSSIAHCYRAAELARGDVEVALLGTFFSKANNARLKRFTHGRINNITPPEVTLSKKVDWDIRKNIYKGESACNFDIYFWGSIKHCLPTVYLENFKELFDAYRADIYKRKFKYIASESWISDVWHSIYIASATHHGKEFIAIEHAAGNVFLENGMHFVDLEFSDKFVSTGWSRNSQNLVSGGFMSKDILIHRKNSKQFNILFVTFTRFIYWEEFNEENATNSFFFERIERISKFAGLLPKNLKNNFLVRPRSAEGLWNVKNLLSLSERHINVDHGDYSKSINSAKLIVIDHMSTGFAEILQNRVPFILLYEINNIPLSADLKLVFDQLLASKVLHTTPESAVAHLVACYSNIEGWWENEQVQASIHRLTSFYLHPADRTISYLAGLLKKEPNRKPNVFKRITIHIYNALGFCLRALRMVVRLIGTRFRVLSSA
jgi:putative transferase (TIGR04331 family)